MLHSGVSMDVVMGIKNIQRNLEPESQWKRVVICMQKLSNFEIAQAWVTLTSSINTQINDAHAIVIHSQYKVIFDRALAEAFPPAQVEVCCGGHGKGDADISVLRKYKSMLDEYHRYLFLAVTAMKEKQLPVELNMPRPVSAGSEDSNNSEWPADPIQESISETSATPMIRATESYTTAHEADEATTEDIRPLKGQVESLKTNFIELNETVIQLSQSLGSVLTLTQKNSHDLTESKESLIRDFNDRLDSLKTDIETKLNCLESMPKNDLPQESGIDDTPTRPVTTSTEIIEVKQKLESILSDITRLKERFSALEAVKFTRVAVAIGNGRKMKTIPANIIYNPLTGARRKTDEDSSLMLDELNGEFISRISYLKELKTKLKTSTVENYMQETDAKLKIALSRNVSKPPTSSASAPTPPASP